MALVRSWLARNSRERSLRLAERRKIATICRSTWRLFTNTARGLCIVHDHQGKQSQCQRTRTILGPPKQAPTEECAGANLWPQENPARIQLGDRRPVDLRVREPRAHDNHRRRFPLRVRWSRYLRI